MVVRTEIVLTLSFAGNCYNPVIIYCVNHILYAHCNHTVCDNIDTLIVSVFISYVIIIEVNFVLFIM
jgi:hypothetical protein